MSRARRNVDKLLSLDEDLPASSHMLLFLIAGIIITFIFFANVTYLDELTRGAGEVVPSQDVQIISNLEGGIVEEIFVRTDDEVKKGEPLMRLRDVNAISEFESNKARVLGLQAAIVRLTAESAGETVLAFPEELVINAPEAVAEEKKAFQANRQQIQGQLNILEDQQLQREQEVNETRTAIRGVQEQITLIKSERDQIMPAVQRGSLPQFELVELEQRLAQKQAELDSLQSSLPRLRTAVEEARKRKQDLLDTAKAQAQAELSEKTAEVLSIEKKLVALEDRKIRTEIISPVHGIVKNIKVTTLGGVVKPGEDIIEIVPKDDRLVIEARIKPEDVGFLKQGQDAVIKLTSYDFTIYGGLSGTLTDISADTIKTDEGESFYRARIETDRTSLSYKGQELAIRPGMQASVDIVTGRKSIMDYILKPIHKTISGSLRER